MTLVGYLHVNDCISLIVIDGEEQDSDHMANQMDVFDQDTYLWKDNLEGCTQSETAETFESASETHEPQQFHDPELELISSSTHLDAEAIDMTIMPELADTMLFSTNNIAENRTPTAALVNFLPRPFLAPKLRVYTNSALSEHLECIQRVLRLGGSLHGGSRSAIQPLIS